MQRVMTHRWRWRKRLPERHDQLCRVLATGRMNSALVEFEDGHKVITSRHAVRKLPNHPDLRVQGDLLLSANEK